MIDDKSRLPWWPFILVDIFFLGLAALLLRVGHRPFLWWEAGFLMLCAAGGAWSFLTPFLRRYELEQGFSQVKLLADATGQIEKLEELATQISHATAQWHDVQNRSAETAEGARTVADKMTTEAKAFVEFMKKAGESEKAHLRLEVDKLRRTETEWIQIVVHILDHVFAFSQAARRSGQPALVEQVGQFQNSCRDAARRVGLAPTLGQEGEAFDPKLHQLAEDKTPGDNAVVADTVLSGYQFQGKLLRRPVVVLRETADNGELNL
jgi:molecular chaperone GrpE (heat shock protein)